MDVDTYFSVVVILPVARLLLEFLQFPRAADLWSPELSRAPGNHLRRGKPLIGKCVVSGFQHEPLNHLTPKGLWDLMATANAADPRNRGLELWMYRSLYIYMYTSLNLHNFQCFYIHIYI